MKKIMFTGGGSAGHVTVNMALIPYFVGEDWSIVYVGSYQGIERQLMEQFSTVQYVGISTGKLRRYAAWLNRIPVIIHESDLTPLVLCKPMLLVPLSKQASRGDQILNAEAFQRAGYCEILQEEQLTEQQFVQSIQKLVRHKDAMIERMKSYNQQHAVKQIIQLIESTSKDE